MCLCRSSLRGRALGRHPALGPTLVAYRDAAALATAADDQAAQQLGRHLLAAGCAGCDQLPVLLRLLPPHRALRMTLGGRLQPTPARSAPRRPLRRTQQLALPPIAVLQPFHHPLARSIWPLAVGEQVRERRPVEDTLQQ